MTRSRTSLIGWALVVAIAVGGGCGDPDETGDSGGVSDGSNADATTGPGGGGGGGSFVAADEVAVAVNPSSVAFGLIYLGAEAAEDIVISHSGTSGTLVLTEVALLDGTGDLTLSEPSTTELAPGESTTVTVRYEPTDAEPDAAVVRIATNAPATDGGAVVVEVPVSTESQTSAVVADSTLLAFGAVASFSEATKPLVVRNLGSLTATITELTLESDSGEFRLVEPPDLPATVEVGGNFEVTVAYAPEGQDLDTGAATVAYEALDGSGEIVVALSGREVSARLVADPDPLDFGLRLPGESYVESVSLTNQGEVPLEVSAVELVPSSVWWHTLSLGDWPAEGVVIEVGESWPLDVAFSPEVGMLAGSSPLASLRITSNDPLGGGVVEVNVHGNRAGGGLEVYPPDILPFGYVGVGGSVLREVVLYNAGTAELNMEHIFIEGPYVIEDDEAWPPTDIDAPAPVVMAPGELRSVWVRFTNGGGLLETAWGKLIIESDDGARPVWEVLLNAYKVEEAGCVVQFTPADLDFGLVTPGEVREAVISLRNIGTNTCGFHSAVVDGCEGPGACETVPPDMPLIAGTSPHYSVPGLPDIAVDNLPPGGVVGLTVRFTAPLADPDDVVSHPALLRARVSTIGEQSGQEEITVHPSASSWLKIPNLTADVASGRLVVDPPEARFDLVEIGCLSETVVLSATNEGLAPLEITGWALVGCPDEVVVGAAPPATGSTVLQVGDVALFEVSYVPEDDQLDSCTLEIESSDRPGEPTIVPIEGEGSYTGDKVDVYTDSESQKVDVLFIVDDSGSMGQEQANLAGSFEAFIMEAATWNSDYQIGVTTTTVDLLSLDGGILRGSPTYVTDANWEKFIYNVMVGTTGSGTEQGLWGAQIAVSSPLVDTSEDLCGSDSDCGLFMACYEDDAAQASLCKGINHGFLREDAALELVFVSDEEDQSPNDLEFYLNFFRELKGFDRPDLLHMHAIVGPPGGCSSDNGVASPGLRYINLANATGGAVYSICELDFAKGLEGIGEIAFASQMEYFLTQEPVPTSLTVDINGLPCPRLTAGTFNWTYDADENSVTLTEQGICTAGPGDLVEIGYDLLCYEPAP